MWADIGWDMFIYVPQKQIFPQFTATLMESDDNYLIWFILIAICWIWASIISDEPVCFNQQNTRFVQVALKVAFNELGIQKLGVHPNKLLPSRTLYFF